MFNWTTQDEPGEEGAPQHVGSHFFAGYWLIWRFGSCCSRLMDARFINEWTNDWMGPGNLLSKCLSYVNI